MKERLKKIGKDLMTSNNVVFTFLRSGVSSQTSGLVDLCTGIGLVALGVSEWIATPAGAVAGGIVNCVLNYKFTFHAQGCSKVAVAVKYIMIWFGSLLLNTFGTNFLAMALEKWDLLTRIGFSNVGSYAAARIIVSILVSWFWNFLMQRNFVYRKVKFDNVITGFVGRLWPHYAARHAVCQTDDDKTSTDTTKYVN